MSEASNACQHLNPLHYTASVQGRGVFKDQCSKCFDSPKTKHGIYVCLKCFNGFCPGDHLAQHLDKFPEHILYLHIEMFEVPVPQQGYEISKIAIGKEGGALGGPEFKTEFSFHCAKCKSVVDVSQIKDATIKGLLQSLISCESAYKKQSLVQWELEVHPCQHTLTLQQVPGNIDLSKCGECQLSSSLWLCLTCGHIGCARKNFDGSGGNNHGVEHYEKTGHPLVVKSGTITADGKASIHCYSCGDQVQDDLLRPHLKTLGIDIADQRKTQKTILELTLDMNLNIALNRLVEDGKQMTPMYGKQYTGIDNIGNSCYINSVVQALFNLQEFRQTYYLKGLTHMKECMKVPNDCFYCQVGKVAAGLFSGKYSQPLTKTVIINEAPQEENYQLCIQPYDFKVMVAKNHQDFSSTQQQDALEYLQYLFDRLASEEKLLGTPSTTAAFDFISSNKLICMGCDGVKVVDQKTNQWKFPVSHPTEEQLKEFQSRLDSEKNQDVKESKSNDEPQYHTTFQKCLNLLAEGDVVEANCPKCKKQCAFKSIHLFKTTPKYLVAVANRFVMDNWSAKKLNANIQMGDSLNIERFMLNNNKQGGSLLPENQAQVLDYSEPNVDLICEMGFSKNAAIRALSNNQDNVGNASNWLYEHLEDTDLNEPFTKPNSQHKVPQELILQLQDFGYSQQQAQAALITHGNNIELAANYLMENDGDVSALVKKSAESTVQDVKSTGSDVHLNYELYAVIVHLGKSVHSGHYVVYIRKEGKWILFNDSRVFETVDPALGKGYIYLYRGV